ncbi:hypothetical protein EB796_001958 [Bugula neritina]|uniref:Uncharacterized protein n=1 Tax=Bugula neritina TaxID=10212 RepID=A0A7J7KNJ0_BUGNE|nr:hypothetical protein EB796_001958 [Bugula neritina]
MANPGPKQCKHYEDGLDTCSPTKYKKIETFHTNDSCFYKKGTTLSGITILNVTAIVGGFKMPKSGILAHNVTMSLKRTQGIIAHSCC